MHGEAPVKKKDEPVRLRKANECISAQKYFAPAGRLFDEFWRKGELALLFGAAGTGKSVLATQIAEGIARGSGVEGFLVTQRRQRVLYVDMKLSEPRYRERYTVPDYRYGNEGAYQFSENLYRDSPPDVDKLDEWLRERVPALSVRVVVIDDLSAVKKTADGTRDTLKLMRELRKLTREFGVSILAIAGAREPGWGRFTSEADLQRSRVLCDIADSTFAIGRLPNAPETRYLIQTRSLEECVWRQHNAPLCVLHKSDDGFLGFHFDKRFIPRLDEHTRRLICDVKRRRDNNASFRVIGEQLGFSRTKAANLLKQWRPEFDRPGDFDDEPGSNPEVIPGEPHGGTCETPEVTGGFQPEDDASEWDECDLEKPVWLDEFAGESDMEDRVDEPPAEDIAIEPSGPDAVRYIFRALGYEARLDEYGKELFVESEDVRGRPVIAYQFQEQYGKTHKECRLNRWHYDDCGRSGTTVNGPVCCRSFQPHRPGILHKARVYLKHNAEART